MVRHNQMAQEVSLRNALFAMESVEDIFKAKWRTYIMQTERTIDDYHELKNAYTIAELWEDQCIREAVSQKIAFENSILGKWLEAHDMNYVLGEIQCIMLHNPYF